MFSLFVCDTCSSSLWSSTEHAFAFHLRFLAWAFNSNQLACWRPISLGIFSRYDGHPGEIFHLDLHYRLLSFRDIIQYESVENELLISDCIPVLHILSTCVVQWFLEGSLVFPKHLCTKSLKGYYASFSVSPIVPMKVYVSAFPQA